MFLNKQNPSQPQLQVMIRNAQQKRSHSERVFNIATQPQLHRVYETLRTDYRGFSSTLHPDGTQLTLFNQEHLYQLNMATGSLCEIVLKAKAPDHVWARRSEWNADGRFLALLVAHGEDLPTHQIDLQLIDTTNGSIQQVNLPTPLIFDFAWARNGRQLLALGNVATDSTGYSLLGLFAIDAQRGTSRRVLPEQTFGVGAFTNQGGGLAWSDDGQRLVINYLVWSDDKKAVRGDRLCRVDVQVKP